MSHKKTKNLAANTPAGTHVEDPVIWNELDEIGLEIDFEREADEDDAAFAERLLREITDRIDKKQSELDELASMHEEACMFATAG